MSRHHFYCMPLSGQDAQAVTRRGLTLVEILIAVALMTIIMLAAVQVLSYVSTELTRAQNAMAIAGRARAAQLQLERDLACITAPLTPPLRFDDAQGYFCYIEGLGSHYGNRLVHGGKIGWGLEDIAVNSETGEYDSTIGDCDDILMFTARAPGDQMYRGLVGGKIMESKEAEICYFLRGTTLYRRVLLILPDEQLQVVLSDSRYSNSPYPVKEGYGFYRDFDVSVRLDENGQIRANTLADLTRRENRFGHALPGANLLPFPHGIHNDAAWYQLRLPTLAECTMDESTESTFSFWQAGKTMMTNGLSSNLLYNDSEVNSTWVGDPVNLFPRSIPYIDYWNNPLPWDGVSANALHITTGADLYVACPWTSPEEEAFLRDRYVFGQRTNEDVLMTNVIGFDIKAWHPGEKKFIDLGELKTNFERSTPDVNEARRFSKDLGSQGFYGMTNSSSPGCYANDEDYVYGFLPCVYDTWTDACENDATGSVLDYTGTPIQGIGVDPAYDGFGFTDIMEHVDQWRCPPPYNVPLTGIQIKIRVFDPDTKNIREVTIRKNFN